MTQKAVKKTLTGKGYKMIAVKSETYSKLLRIGTMGDSMDSVISKLLEDTGAMVPKSYQCSVCGVFISTVVDPTGFECYTCKKVTEWRRGDY